ncbi:MAG: DUF1997 domain-containing protein [Xenococcaceae cyanobacterium]
MQCQFINNQPIDCSELPVNEQICPIQTDSRVAQLELAEQEPVHFQTHFEGFMYIYTDAQTFAEYLDAHEGWFCRCAQPMKAEPLGNNGYTLTIGRFGSFGYEVEPKISVVLEPSKEGVYLMYTIPVPDYTPPGYEVDYKAWMELVEIPSEAAALGIAAAYKKKGEWELPPVVTRVNWELHLKVAVKFPKFIYKLPLSLIQTTGDRLLAQILRQVSPRLTYKVQKDFHSRLNLPIPLKSARKFQKISRGD